MIEYYGKLLLAIPLFFGLGVLASAHQAIALHHGLVAGSLLSTLVLFEAMYRNPPTEPTWANVAASIVVFSAWTITIVFYLR